MINDTLKGIILYGFFMGAGGSLITWAIGYSVSSLKAVFTAVSG